jgi:hypothetical protein
MVAALGPRLAAIVAAAFKMRVSSYLAGRGIKLDTLQTAAPSTWHDIEVLF